jgi:hypothetical protein
MRVQLYEWSCWALALAASVTLGALFYPASSAMSLEQRMNVQGGAGLCLSGSAGTECNNTDTQCSQGDDYCIEAEDGVLCADKISYKNPTRCITGGETTLCCENKADTEIPCYETNTCTCAILEEGAGWTCSNEMPNLPGEGITNVTKCVVKKCE